jgi:hypothetical protein
LVAGENVSLVVKDNNVIINATNSGSEEPEINIIDYIQGDGIVITEISSNTKKISVDDDYIKD